jgi:hypothetical protein
MQRNPYRPLNGPRFFSALRFHVVFFFTALGKTSAQVKFRGTDGKLTTTLSPEKGRSNRRYLSRI